ncbi:MAG: nucleoside-diphosphate sugar epimerase [Phycisphaerales bacterium]|nr:nucleoside-diphosphate sugar epimerase [Phycisphaerales bacterium]
MSSPVFVTGGSGFVGSAVVDELLARGHPVHALTNHRPIDKSRVTNFPGGLFDTAAVKAAMAGCAAVVHLVGIIRESGDQTFDRIHVEGTRQMLEQAKALNIPRFVYQSALGAKANGASRYSTTKFAAENLVRQSGLDWAIVRPSVIFGPNGEFVKMIADFAKGKALPYVFMPYFGVGVIGNTPKKLQPVDVRDVARAIVDAVDRPELAGQTINLVGSQVADWRQVYQVIGETVTPHPRPAVGLPAWYGKLLTSVLPQAWLPFNKSQVVMASEDNVADVAETERQLGWKPRPFAAAFRESMSGSH